MAKILSGLKKTAAYFDDIIIHGAIMENVKKCKLEGYLDMLSAESCRVSSASSFNTSMDLPEHFGSFSKLDTYELVSVTYESYTSTKFDSAAQLSNKEKLSPDDELLEIISDFKNNVFTIAEVEALVESWQNRNDVQQSFRDKHEQLNRMREEYEKIQGKMKEQMKRTTPFEKIRKFFSRGKPKNSESSERTSTSSDVSATQIRAMSSLSMHSSSSTSSGSNSISGGHSLITDDANERSTSLVKLNKLKANPYAAIPQPPNCLHSGVNIDFFEYAQPDSYSNKLNTNQTCNGSVLNDTIQECNEHEISDTHSIYSHSSSKGKEGCSPVTHTKCRFNSNSLRVNSKRKKKNKIRTKVKSVENLIHEGAKNRQIQIPKPLNDLKSRTELSICATTLCAKTLKYISDENISSEEGHSSNNITFIFNKAESCSTSEGGNENKSDKSSSSLNLSSSSSSSINSNCTVDENGEIEAGECSLQLNITEKSDKTETTPSSSENDQSYLNIRQLPEYVNVNVKCEC